MHLLYPENPLDKTQADLPYQEEHQAVRAAGYESSLFNFDALALGDFCPHPKFQPNAPVLYRGWMLTPQHYQDLIQQIEQQGGIPITSHAHYLQCHHLPGWYQTCARFTPETYFFDADENLESKISALNWDRYFVKDYVKSNTGEKGSIAQSTADVCAIAAEIKTYRGEIEGGIAIRRVETYRPQTERRYFVVKGQAYSPDGDVPELIKTIASVIDAPFYSMDIIENTEGTLRLVELGDGQVSDKKDWPLSKFVEVLGAIAESLEDSIE